MSLGTQFESRQALERAVSNARLGPKAVTSLPIGRSRPSASNFHSHCRTASSSNSRTHQTYRCDLHGSTIPQSVTPISSTQRRQSSALEESHALRYQLRLVFRHASKHDSKRLQAIQGSELLILEPSTLEKEICGEYEGWTKFLKHHILLHSWLWQEFVKLIPYDQTKEINRKLSIDIIHIPPFLHILPKYY